MYQIPCKTEGEHAKMSQMPCKMTDSSSKLLQTPGKWHQERNNKKNQTSPKKLKLFFTPFKYDRRYFFKKSSLFNAGGWNTCLFGYHVALCVHSDDYVDCLPWLPAANHFRGLRNMHPKLWKVQQWTSRNYRHDPKLWKSDMFDWFSLNLWISMDIYGYLWSFLILFGSRLGWSCEAWPRALSWPRVTFYSSLRRCRVAAFASPARPFGQWSSARNGIWELYGNYMGTGRFHWLIPSGKLT